jgi:hypothetical protein
VLQVHAEADWAGQEQELWGEISSQSALLWLLCPTDRGAVLVLAGIGTAAGWLPGAVEGAAVLTFAERALI